MAPLKCCVGGCDATSDIHRLFSMPKNDNLRSLWLSFLVPTNPLLIGLTKEQLLRKRVCHKHFERHQLYGEVRRTRYSYPSLFSAEEISHGVPLSSEKSTNNFLAEHNYHQDHEEDDNDVTAEPLFISRAGNFIVRAIKKLKNLMFKDSNSKFALKLGKPRLEPCLEGWVITIESFVRISKLLFTKYEVKYYYPRCINQDPLEFFFGRIKVANYRNINPDAHTFKSLLLSNLLSPHSRFSNCEEDDGKTLINLKFIFENKESDKENVQPKKENVLQIPLPSSSSQQTEPELKTQVLMEKIKVHCSAYTAGYICRKITKSNNCSACIKTYTSVHIESIHKYIEYKEYKSLKRNNLAYPNTNFLRLYRDTADIIHNYLNANSHKKNVGRNIRNILCKKLEVSWMGCKKHHNDVVKVFYSIAIRMQVHNWCKILKGDLEEKYVMKMNEPQKMAYKKYEKIRLRKKKLYK